jgi:trehalose 6-phosphate synthase/phosphatase
MTHERLLIVSNRLPVSVGFAAGGLQILPSSGGLASGLRPWHERSGSIWFGWPGDISAATEAEKEQLDRCLERRLFTT